MSRAFLLSLSLIFSLIMPTFTFGQETFYYAFDYEKIPLSVAQQKVTVETIDEGNNVILSKIGKKLQNNIFLVDNYTKINLIINNFVTHPVYITASGTELYVTSDILLHFKPNITTDIKQKLISDYNLTHVKTTTIYEKYTCEEPLKTSQLIYETNLVTFCHPDFIDPNVKPNHIPNDEYFDKQFYLHNTGQVVNDGHAGTIDADIDAPEAWDITKGNPNIVIAVIDEGVTANHPDLPNTRQIRLPGSNIGAQHDSSDPNDPKPIHNDLDGSNHGNACAGIIAATQDNGIGVSGIAPLCKIMPIRVAFGKGISQYADAIEFATIHNADIISNSYSIRDSRIYPSIVVAIKNALQNNIVVIYSAGNSADHVRGDKGEVEFPANTSKELVDLIAVGASDRNNQQANYSPTDSYNPVDLVAPSHTAYNSRITGEAYNVWSIDIPGDLGYNTWRKPSTFPLPAVGEMLPSTGSSPLNYTGRMGGTSSAAPQVAGVAALMLSVNNCLSNKQVKNILLQTADKVGNYDYRFQNYQGSYSYEMGSGKLNAHKAVSGAQKLFSNTLDLSIKDRTDDIGYDAGYPWTWDFDNSPDIWVRNQDDGLVNQKSEAPVYQGNDEKVYVYVRINNISCALSTASEKIALYWSRASTSSSWPENWDGSEKEVGGLIGKINIPIIQPGEETIVKFTWDLQQPEEFSGFQFAEWHSCLLTRIEESNDDPITVHPERLEHDVYYNNNVAMRNLVIYKITSGKPFDPTEFFPKLYIGNASNDDDNFDIVIRSPKSRGADEINNNIDLTIEFDPAGWEIIKPFLTDRADVIISGLRQITILSDNDVYFNNLFFPAKTRVPITLNFNLTAQTNALLSEEACYYHISQKRSESDLILGDNWTGNVHFLLNKDFKIPPDLHKKTTQNKITTTGFIIYPNPSNNIVTLTNLPNKNGDILIQIRSIGSREVISEYQLHPEQKTLTIDVSEYPSGAYLVTVVNDNKLIDSQKLMVY